MTSAHKHQMRADAPCLGRHVVGGETRRLTVDAHQFQMGRTRPRVQARARVGHSTALNCRGLSPDFLSSCARRSLVAAPGRFARDPLIGRTVCKFCRAIERRGSLLCLRKHVRYHTADAAKCHSIRRLSSWAGFDDQQPNERPFTRVQEPFAFGATEHE